MLINIERIHVWLSLLKIWVGCKPPTPFLITRNAGFGHRHWQVYNWLSSLSCMYDIIYTSGLPVLLVTEAQFLGRWATVLHYTFNEKKNLQQCSTFELYHGELQTRIDTIAPRGFLIYVDEWRWGLTPMEDGPDIFLSYMYNALYRPAINGGGGGEAEDESGRLSPLTEVDLNIYM